ncbi:hypothetical protein DV735_g294, partial [Chaetothyriales sp. CBS 134920]
MSSIRDNTSKDSSRPTSSFDSSAFGSRPASSFDSSAFGSRPASAFDKHADSRRDKDQDTPGTSGYSAVSDDSLEKEGHDLDETRPVGVLNLEDSIQDVQAYRLLGTCFNNKHQHLHKQGTHPDGGNPQQQNELINHEFRAMDATAGQGMNKGHEEQQLTGWPVAVTGREEAGSRREASRSPSPMLERAGFKKPRDRQGWYYSRPHATYPASASWGPNPVEMGRGRQSGRNHLAKFGDDPTPRLKWHLMIRNAKEEHNNATVRAYPDPKVVPVPARTSLKEMCERYPRHVWGTGLRLFGCEQWGAKEIWELLPRDYRLESAAQRPWNYLQAAMGRELDKVAAEEGTPRVKKPDPKRRRTPPESGESDSFGDIAMAMTMTEPARKRQRSEQDLGPAMDDLMQWSHEEQGRSLSSFAMRLLAERFEYQMADDQNRGAIMAEFWSRQLSQYADEIERQHQQPGGGQDMMIADLPALAGRVEEMVRRLRPREDPERWRFEAWRLVWLKLREKSASLML